MRLIAVRLHRPLALAAVALALASLAACGKKPAPTAQPATAPPAADTTEAKAPAATPPEAATPTPAPQAATATDAKPEAAPDNNPTQNGWNLPARGTSAKEGDRVFVLTRGKDRSYSDAGAVYHLFAHDLGEVRGDVMTVKELDGGSFQVTGLFVVPAGAKAEALQVGDMVLAEWASSLNHAVVTKLDGDKIHVRYTDLPDTWKEDQITAVKAPREVTKQQEGLHPGNFAVALEDGRPIQVLLVADSGDKWLVRRFAKRMAVFAKSDLKPIPLKPPLKPGQLVQAPWVGMMYKAKVKKVTGTRVEVLIDGIATKEPVVTSLGQVVPDGGK